MLDHDDGVVDAARLAADQAVSQFCDVVRAHLAALPERLVGRATAGEVEHEVLQLLRDLAELEARARGYEAGTGVWTARRDLSYIDDGDDA